jgi:hypothetical protein
MGDKTQIATVVLARRFASLAAVVLGTTLGMLLANVPGRADRQGRGDEDSVQGRAHRGGALVRGARRLRAHRARGGGRAARSAEERANLFGDPFVQVTSGIADCPPQQGPMITQSEMRAEAHPRAERGTRCFESGRCRLPNSYLYDKEIIPRVQKAIVADGRFHGNKRLGRRPAPLGPR